MTALMGTVFFVFVDSRLMTSHVTQAFGLGNNGTLILMQLQRILNLACLTNVKFFLLFFVYQHGKIVTPVTSLARWFSRSAKQIPSLHKGFPCAWYRVCWFAWASMKVFSNPSSVECFELYYLFLPTHLSKS
jgi:hypothetical protein